jgi:SAM-dependent methyltransferase
MDIRALLEAACTPYRRAGAFAYHFARGKLRTDPVYRAILALGLLTDRARILDLGCGQGLLFAWLQAAQTVSARGEWPAQWPAAPRPVMALGIELMPREVARAQAGLETAAVVVRGDIRTAEFMAADAVVILDVLHYLEPAHQHEVLLRARKALPTGGLLLLRVADAGSGFRYHYTRLIDRFVLALRGHATGGLHCRSLEEWRALLRDCGFTSEIKPMSQGTPFANVLLIATAI